MHYLFSYGTLRLENVQLDLFGRKLEGEKDILPGYILRDIQIHDPLVVEKSGQSHHLIAVPSGDAGAVTVGMLYLVTEQELQVADDYEVDAYKRIRARFGSGKDGWVYVSVEMKS